VMCVGRDAARAGGGGVGAGADVWQHELVIQDARRPTGRREYLEGLDGSPNLDGVGADAGQGQGLNRRCAVPGRDHRIDDADNRLRPRRCDGPGRRLRVRDAAVVYRAMRHGGCGGEVLHPFLAGGIRCTLGLLDGSIVPPVRIVVLFPTAVRRRAVFDEDFRWCRTLRCGCGCAPPSRADPRRADGVRVSRRVRRIHADAYERYGTTSSWGPPLLARRRPRHTLEYLRRRAEAGIYLWCRGSLQVIGGVQERIDAFFAKRWGARPRANGSARCARAKPRVIPLTPSTNSNC